MCEMSRNEIFFSNFFSKGSEKTLSTEYKKCIFVEGIQDTQFRILKAELKVYMYHKKLMGNLCLTCIKSSEEGTEVLMVVFTKNMWMASGHYLQLYLLPSVALTAFGRVVQLVLLQLTLARDDPFCWSPKFTTIGLQQQISQSAQCLKITENVSFKLQAKQATFTF